AQLVEHALREGLLELHRERANFSPLHPILPIYLFADEVDQIGWSAKSSLFSLFQYIIHL
ncbi:MAG: hypothetical protein ACREYC_18195, partial [Gammaproteobacteria bacterium]